LIVLAIQEFYYEILEYSLLTFYLTAKKDKQIWVRYNDEHVSIKQSSLEDLAVSNVDDLKVIIKNRFKLSGNITIRSGGDNLEDSELVTGLYNTKDNALEVIVEENGMHKIVAFKNFNPYTLVSKIF